MNASETVLYQCSLVLVLQIQLDLFHTNKYDAVWSMQVVSTVTMGLISHLTAEKRRRKTSILIWIVSTILWNDKACRLVQISVYKFLSWTDWECHPDVTKRTNKNKMISLTSSTIKTKRSSPRTQSIKAILSPPSYQALWAVELTFIGKELQIRIPGVVMRNSSPSIMWSSAPFPSLPFPIWQHCDKLSFLIYTANAFLPATGCSSQKLRSSTLWNIIVVKWTCTVGL